MGKIRASDLIAQFKRMYDEHWTYVWGSAKRGEVDCSGAFVYAYKTLDGPYIEHGSNAIARRRVGAMQPVSAARPGWAAFKWKQDGAPDSYTDGRGNYYHIGLVDETGGYVLNAKGSKYGFCRDRLAGWDYVAPLDAVEYTDEGEDDTMDVKWVGEVVTLSGPLNLRDEPNITGDRIAQIPRSSRVNVLWDEPRDGWLWVQWGNRTGYVSAEYLRDVESIPDTPQDGTGGSESGSGAAQMVSVPMDLLREADELAGKLAGVAAKLRAFAES